MRNALLTFLLFVFCNNAFADCPEYEVTLEYTDHVGATPNEKDICSVSLANDMGFGHSQFIRLIYFDETLLPKNIADCTQFDAKSKKWTGSFTFDETEVSNTPEDLARFGIYTVFHSYDQEDVDIVLLDNGRSLQLSKYLANTSSEELDVDAFLYSWEESSKGYLFTEFKKAKTTNLEIETIKNSIANSDFKALSKQLEAFNFGGDYGAPFNKLPKEVTNDLWTNLHKKALAHYKKGNKTEAAQLVASMLDLVPVSYPNELDKYYLGRDVEYFYNYAIDALYHNPKLLTPISDCAFFLEQGDLQLDSAASIFSAILRDYPNRTVAYLNFADSLWKQKEYEKAKVNYQVYVQEMTTLNKKSTIPNYVITRLNQ